MGITTGLEAHEIVVKTDETWISHLEIQTCNASKESGTAHLDERISENIQFEVGKKHLHRVGNAEKENVSIIYRSMS